jgi:ribose transport system permease protein
MHVRRSPRRFPRSTILRLLGTYGTIIVLVVMLAAFSIAEPGTFATIGNFRNILNDMAIGTIVAGGLTMPLVAGDFDLSIGYVASFCGLGNNGLAMIGAPIFTQYLFAGSLLVIAVALGSIGRRHARDV